MPEITPNDIVHTKFRVALRGYDIAQVDDFMRQVSDALYHALEEGRAARAKVEEMRGQLGHFQQTESLMKNALILAERAADETRQRAHQEADLIVREADERLRGERAELENTRQLRYRLLAELRAILQSHLAMLDAQEGPFARTSPPPGEE